VTYDPLKHHRRSIRLKGYDYTRAGAYFITVVVQDRACLFGEVVDGVMQLNAAGQMMQGLWEALPLHYHGVDTDEFVVMPNHLHGIVVLTGGDDDGAHSAGDNVASMTKGVRQPPGQALGPAPSGAGATTLSLPAVVHRFKSLTTTRYSMGVREHRWQAFRRRLWQRNYYEEVIRNQAALDGIRRYVAENPLGWEYEENPWRVGFG
jgi:putative transposase